MSFFEELKRRKVFRVAVAYAIVAWLLVQIADTTFERLLLPDWLHTALIVFLLFGFPIALILAWAFEISPERETSDQSPDESPTRPPVATGWIRGGYLLLAGATLALGLWLGNLGSDGPENGGTVKEPPNSVAPQSFDPTASLRLPLHLPNFADRIQLTVSSRLAISPDGRRIAYIGFDGTDVQLFLKNADETVPGKISNSDGAVTPFFSPDGDEVAFFAKGSFWRVSTSGTQNPVPINAVPGFANGASWGDDGNIVFGVGYRSVLHSVPSAGGPVTRITEHSDGEVSHRHPHVLPGSRGIVFQSGFSPAEIWVLDRLTGERQFLMNGMEPRFANNNLLFLRDAPGGNSLWSVDFNIDTLQAIGEPKPLATESMGSYNVSQTGALIYSQNRPWKKTRLLMIDEAGNEETIFDARYINAPRFSPNGKLLALDMVFNDQEGVWILGLATNSKPYLLGDDSGGNPAWTVDSSSIAYERSLAGIWSVPINLSEPPEALIKTNRRSGPHQLTPDGLLYGQSHPQTQGDIFFLRNDKTRITIDDDEFLAVGGRISPDGRWVAYSKMKTFRYDVFVKSITGKGPARQVSTIGGSYPKWSPTGDALYYYSYDKIMRVSVNEGDAIKFGEPEIFHQLGGRESNQFDPFDISPDGKHFAIVDLEYGEPPPPIFITNWQHALLSN